MPGDGYVDPHIATYAVAAAARELGVEIRTRDARHRDRRARRPRCARSRPSDGAIECETVVNAAGMWAPRVAAMVGAFACSIPVDHQHIALHAVEGHELPRETPCFRDTDNLVYGKAESGGVLFGGYEPNPVSRWERRRAVGARRADAAARPRALPAADGRRRPALPVPRRRGRDRARLPSRRDDAGRQPAARPDARRARASGRAAGLSLNGFGGAGGLGKALAELVTSGEAEVDVQPYRPWRFGGPYRDPEFAAAAAREVYKYYYRLRYPLRRVARRAGRSGCSPLHARLRGARRRLRDEERLGARRLLPAGRAGRHAGEEQRAVRLGAAAVARPRRGRARARSASAPGSST